MKKEILNRWLGIVLVAVLVLANAPQVFGALVDMVNPRSPSDSTFGAIYGYNTVSGRYSYGYGYGYNYWASLTPTQRESEPYVGYATDPGQTAIPVGVGTTVIGGAIAGGTTITGPSSGIATVDFANMETGSFTFSGTAYSQQVELGNTSGTVTFEDGASSGVSVEFAAGTTFYSDDPADFTAFQVPTFGSVAVGAYTTSGGYDVDPANILAAGGTGAAHIHINPAATVYYPYTGTIPEVIAFRTTAGWTTAPMCTGGVLGASQDICFWPDSANNRIIIYTRVFSQFTGGTSSSSGGTSSGGGGGGVAGVYTICGNGQVEGAEQCDDGNTISGDGCSSVCRTETTGETEEETTVTTPDGKEFTVPAGTTIRTSRFPDVSRSSWYNQYVEVLRQAGVIHGTVAGNFEPGRDLTRGELVKIALNTFSIEVASSVSSNPFRDVSRRSWAAPYIQKAKSLGIISGYADGTFRPNDKINRVEALKILLLASGLEIEGGYMNFPDTTSGAWYQRYVALAQSLGIVSGYPDGTFGPGNSIKRSEMAKIAVKTLEETLQ